MLFDKAAWEVPPVLSQLICEPQARISLWFKTRSFTVNRTILWLRIPNTDIMQVNLATFEYKRHPS